MALQRHMRIVDAETDDPLMASGLKVAFATTDMQTVNQHFGSAQSFAMFMVNPEKAVLLEAAQFGQLDQEGNEDTDKLAAKIEMLEGCAAVYCQAIGSSAIRQLTMHGVQPMKVSEGAEINMLIEALQHELRQGPSAWLAKAISRQRTPEMNRFDAMEEEGWDE